MSECAFVVDFFVITNIVLQMCLILLGLYSISFIPIAHLLRRKAWVFIMVAWTLLLVRRGVSWLRYEDIVASFFIEQIIGTATTVFFILFAVYIIKSRKKGE